MNFQEKLLCLANFRLNQVKSLTSTGKIIGQHQLFLAYDNFFQSTSLPEEIQESSIITRLSDFFAATAPYRQHVISIPFSVHSSTHRLFLDICSYAHLLLDSIDMPLQKTIGLLHSTHLHKARITLLEFYKEFCQWDEEKQQKICDEEILYSYIAAKLQENFSTTTKKPLVVSQTDIEHINEFIANNADHPDIKVVCKEQRLKAEKYQYEKGLGKIISFFFKGKRRLESYHTALNNQHRIIKAFKYHWQDKEKCLFVPEEEKELIEKFKAKNTEISDSTLETLLSPIEELRPFPQTLASLHRHKIYCIGQLIQINEDDLLTQFEYIGPKSIKNLTANLKVLGLHWGTILPTALKQLINDLYERPYYKKAVNY